MIGLCYWPASCWRRSMICLLDWCVIQYWLSIACHISSRFTKEFPRCRCKDWELHNRSRFRTVHSNTKGYRHSPHKPARMSKASKRIRESGALTWWILDCRPYTTQGRRIYCRVSFFTRNSLERPSIWSRERQCLKKSAEAVWRVMVVIIRCRWNYSRAWR